MKLGLVMLAAGNSRRFGSNKLLYTVDGQPMYRHILSELEKIQKQLESQGTQCSITVVTQYDEIAEDVRKRGISVFYNLHPDEGISSSLRIGLRGSWDTDACLFTVSDQPWLRCETILELIEKFRNEKKGIACVQHNGKTGNPCIFSRKYFYPLTNTFDCYKNQCDVNETPIALKISKRVLTLPLYAELALEEVDKICDVIIGMKGK